MRSNAVRIGVVAPASPLSTDVPGRVRDFAGELFPGRVPDVVFHPQCFAAHGHFAGTDAVRAGAFLEVANDATFDAIWFGRGGYGSCRIAPAVLEHLGDAARRKTYLGYSDAGTLLATLYRADIGTVAHGPVAQDILRDGGGRAAGRALRWLVDRDPATLEPTVGTGRPTAAFNITILSHLLGTPLEPDLAGHVLMLEEVSEAMYRIDRALFHITSNPAIRRVAGIKLGRCSLVTPNAPDFGMSAEEVARHWCARSGIAWLGPADIGHDVDNRIVPFG